MFEFLGELMAQFVGWVVAEVLGQTFLRDQRATESGPDPEQSDHAGDQNGP